MKKSLSGIIFSENRMRQGEKVKKKFQCRIPFILNPGKKILKKIAKKFKNLKTSFRQYFQPKRDRSREREKKILVPNFVHTRPGQENSKKSSKKFKKSKKLNYGIIFSQNGMIYRPRKRKKNFRPEFRSYSTRERKFQKKQQKSSEN